jgi:DNA-binding protein H-NS
MFFMTKRIDSKMDKIVLKMAALKSELEALELSKKEAVISADTAWVADMIETARIGLIESKQKSPSNLIRILKAALSEGETVTKTVTKTVTPKYQDTAPECENNVWSGRGLPPLWMRRYLAAGKNKEDFLIKRAS